MNIIKKEIHIANSIKITYMILFIMLKTQLMSVENGRYN